jgi:class 3 adenylate cyclase/CheY-like chemotaxis protein
MASEIIPGVILIVDDNPTNLEVLLNALTNAGFEVAVAIDGESAIAQIEYDPPDLVLLDVVMPGIDGFETCKRLKDNPLTKDIPVIFTTSLSDNAERIKGLNIGAIDYITKPFHQEEVLARINVHLKLRSLTKELEQQNLLLKQEISNRIAAQTALQKLNEQLEERVQERTAELSQALREIRKINQAYERFVPRQFLQLLDKSSIIDVQLGDQIQLEMSVLFSDIRNFTTLSERMTPADNFKFINSYLSRMEPAIIQNQGFIDKYIGDAIMALFSGEADNAIKAGISILQQLAEYNSTRGNVAHPQLEIGIGINTGSLMLGTVGGQNRMDGTVISDAVNLAARVEDLTKNYGVSLLISEQTYSRLVNPANYAIRVIDTVKVKGKSQAVTVYEVFDADPLEIKQGKLATLQLFKEALSLYNQGIFADAAQLFADCLRQNAGDRAAKIYLQRCQQYQ